MGRNRPGWALGPRKRHSPSCLFKTPPPNWRTERKSWWSPSLLYNSLANFLVLFFHQDSGSVVPTQLLWELILAPCILVFYSYYLGSFSAIWGGWTLSLPLTSRQIYEKSVQSTHFLSFVQCLSLDLSLFLSEFSLCLPVSLSVSPVDGWMALNVHVYF